MLVPIHRKTGHAAPWRVGAVLAFAAAGAAAVAETPPAAPATAAPAAIAPAATAPRPEAGRIAGTVTVGPALAARRTRFHLYPDFVEPPAPRAERAAPSETRNVVVYLEPLDGTPAVDTAPAAPLVMRQEGLSFHPHVLAVRRGATVEFPNGDPVFHNVFSLSKAASFDLGRFPRGASRSVRFDRPGIVKVFCHIHADMSAVIVVLEHPWFAIPDDQGRYRIDGLPAGDYRAVAWHERARPLSRRVRVDTGRTGTLDFSIPLTEPAGGG